MNSKEVLRAGHSPVAFWKGNIMNSKEVLTLNWNVSTSLRDAWENFIGGDGFSTDKQWSQYELEFGEKYNGIWVNHRTFDFNEEEDMIAFLLMWG